MTDKIEYTGSISITQPKPDYHVTFTQGEKTIGRLDFNGDEMTFTGDADASAKKFMEFLSSCFAQRLKEEREKERELCAKLCDELSKRWYDEGGSANDCAAAIRGRTE